MENEPSLLDVADEEFAQINKPETKQDKGSILDIADDEFKKQEEESTQKEFDVAKLEKLKAEGKPLSEVQQRMIFDEQDKVPMLEQAAIGLEKFIPAAAVKVGELSRGAYELAREAVVKPVYVGAKYNLGLATPKETNVAARDAEIAGRSFVSGVASDIEETSNAGVRAYNFGTSFTDKLQGLSADERFNRYRLREDMRGIEQAWREGTPDRAAALLAENVLLQKAAGIATKMQGGNEEDAKAAEKAYSELVLESGLTREELNPYISAIGEWMSPISIPGANIATKTIGKYTGKAVQKGGELALKGVVKPVATGVEKSAEFIEKGIAGVQTGAKKLGEYVTGDPDTLIRGGSIAGLIQAPEITGMVLAAKPATIATKQVARTFKDIASQVDVGGAAGRRGLVERAGRSADSGALTKRLFSAESRGGLGRARAADWMIRQGNAITQQGVNGAVLNTILGLPDIESIEQGFEVAGSGFGMGAFGGSRIMDRAGALIDPRTGLAQKIDTIITPDPSSRRADEDADIKRFLSSVDPDLVPRMEKLGSIDERKKAIQTKIDDLEKKKDVTFGPDVQDIKSKISKLKTTIETLDKATPQTQKEILRQVHLAFAEEMDLAKTTGKAAGLNNIQVKILDPSEMEGFFRSSYGTTLTDAEGVISQLTGNPNLSPQESESLVNARKVVDRFYNEVGSLQSARGAAISDGSETPAFMRKQNLQGATIVINGDLVKQLSGEGFNVRNVVGHEMQHALSQFSEVRDMLTPIRRELFDQNIVNDDGTINKVTQGVYSDEKLDAYADTYAAAMSPSDNGESFKAQFGDQDKLRAYIKEEVLSEIAGRSGRINGGKRAGLDSIGRQVVDWIEVKTQNGVLKTIKETLRKGGIIVDDSGDISTVLGAELTPESLAMIRQYQRQLNNLNQSMVYEGDARKEEVEIPLTKILSDRSLQEKFKNSDIFEKEQVATMTAPDGSKQEIPLPPEAGVDPFVGTYRIQGGQLVDEKGIPMNLGPEITFGTMPDGTQVEVGTRIARNVDGSPKILSNREIEARSRNRGKVIRNAIDSALSKGALQLEDTGNGNYRGVMSETQVNAVLALPNTIVSPNLKRQILFVNEILRRKDGTRMYMEYQAAMRGGKSRALSPQIRDEIPIGFQFSKQGNFLITTISVSRMHDKMNAWLAKKPENLKLWNGDTTEFWSDVIKVLDNHSKGDRGETGLDTDAAVALEKKNAVNDLFNVWNADTKAANPRRTKLPVQKGKDPIDVIVRSRRIDRINQYNESALQKMPFNYELNRDNYMPSENPLADFQTPEDFANDLPSVTAEEIRNAINTGNLDQLESKLREGDDLKPAESLDEENGNIRIVSMFDPAFMPEESGDFVDVKNQETDRAKFLSAELEKMYEEGGTDKRIANYETELEGIFQKLESDQESAATEGEENITESEMNPQDVVFDAINNYKTGRVDNQEQTLAEHIRNVFDSEGEFNISPSVTDAEIESAANDIYNQKATQRQKISGLQFMPAETERYPTSERGMYSGLQKTIDEKVTGKFASPEQLKAIVNNPQNAKAEELKWSGVLGEIDRLATENSGKVPKDKVMEYLRNEGAVKFEEVTLGGATKTWTQSEIDALERQAQRTRNWDAYEQAVLEFEDQQLGSNANQTSNETRFAKYQLPGGANYREVVMTMPIPPTKRKNWGIIYDSWIGPAQLGVLFKTKEEAQSHIDNHPDIKNPRVNSWDFEEESKPSYTSSHFPDTPNYVAHMRLNERTDAQGNDGLFVEEWQSDRHQAGREKGYIQDVKIDENRIFDDNGVFRVKGVYDPSVKFKTKSDALEYLKSITLHGKDLIPDAPFRKDWSIQLFKRALRDAVDADKKWIGWTTGIEQVKRYENAMRQAVDEITWNTPKGYQKAFAAIKNGNTVLAGKINDDGSVYDSDTADANGKQLSEVIGKEVASKILAENSGTATGDDLTVGGEGMKGFYDQIMPKEVGKYVAKMGGKVEKSEIVTPKPDKKIDDFTDAELLQELARKGETTPIWRVNITPEMAGKVRGGQLQFMPAVQTIPERFTGTGKKGEERRGRYVAPPEFWTRFDIGEFNEGGKFFDLETGEDITNKNYATGTIDASGKRPSLVSDSLIDEMPDEQGRTWKTNLFRKSAGWDWISENPPEVAAIGSKEKPNPVLISVENNPDHFYSLKVDFPNGVKLARYPEGGEPRLRPTKKGQIKLGNEVGRIKTSRGKEHIVYDSITIGQPQFMPAETNYLISEAKKFTNPDDFVKSRKRKLFHFSKSENPTFLREGGTLSGNVSTFEERDIPRYKSGQFQKRNLIELYTDGKILDAAGDTELTPFNIINGGGDNVEFNEMLKKASQSIGVNEPPYHFPWNSNDWLGETGNTWRKTLQGELSKKGYVGYQPGAEIVITDPSSIKSKAQLLDIWNESQKGVQFTPAEQPTKYEPISARIRPLEGISAPTKVVGAKALSLGEIKPPVRGKAMLPDMELTPDISEKSIQSSDITTSAKPAPDAVIKPFSNALVSSAGLINFLPAFHGTPFDVDKFKLEKIGTGEGAQAYGWGLYFAQARKVAEEYQEQLSEGLTVKEVPVWNKYGGFNKLTEKQQEFIDIVSSVIPHPKYNNKYTIEEAYSKMREYWDFNKQKLSLIDEAEKNNWLEFSKGNLYKVDLDVKDEDLLDWDKPLSEQSEKVQKSLAGLNGRLPNGEELTNKTKGERIYGAFAEGAFGDTEAASMRLFDFGIPGIRYLDGTSRKQGDGTYNYVVFDENLIKILDKNDKPVQDELPRATGLQFMPARPIGKTEPLPDFETTIIKGITPAKGFKWDKATNVEIDIGGGRKMSFSYDPEYLEVPKFKDLIKELKGQPVILLEADRQRATGGDMGGPLHPFLKSNQVTITGPDGKKYKAVWANMTSTFVSGAKNRLASHGAKYALVHLMDPIAHKSNKRTARTLDRMMRKSKLNQREKEIISLSMQAGIIAGEKSAMSSAITALKRQMSSAKKDPEKIRIINEKINKITKEREDITPKGLYGEIFKAVSSIKTAISNVKTGNWEENSIEKANKKLEKYVNLKEYNELLKNNKSLYISDNIGNTFSERGSAIGSILSFKFGKFDPSLVMRESSDFREGENLDIVTAVELSQNPDIFALYFGNDPKEEAAMSAAERKARDEMRANPDFVEHEAYDWVMLGPEKGNNFLVKNPVKPEQIFKKYRETHAGETVVDGSAETVAGAMRKNAGFILRVDEDTQKVLASKKKNK